jgi:hypothetical protein
MPFIATIQTGLHRTTAKTIYGLATFCRQSGQSLTSNRGSTVHSLAGATRPTGKMPMLPCWRTQPDFHKCLQRASPGDDPPDPDAFFQGTT